MTKDQLREVMKQRRLDISKNEVRRRSQLIMEELLTLPEFFRADVVHTYVSSKNNEVDTHDLIRLLLKQRKKVVVPISDKATRTMRHSELHSLSELVGGPYGILEPRMCRSVPLSELQVVIVPALAVDRTGRRIGFGAGFYDRFLAAVSVPVIALVYDFQIADTVPQENTDIPVSYIVSDAGIVRCRN